MAKVKGSEGTPVEGNNTGFVTTAPQEREQELTNAALECPETFERMSDKEWCDYLERNTRGWSNRVMSLPQVDWKKCRHLYEQEGWGPRRLAPLWGVTPGKLLAAIKQRKYRRKTNKKGKGRVDA